MLGFISKRCHCEPKKPYHITQDIMAMILEHYQSKVDEQNRLAKESNIPYTQMMHWEYAAAYQREVNECKRHMMQEWPLSYRDFKS